MQPSDVVLTIDSTPSGVFISAFHRHWREQLPAYVARDNLDWEDGKGGTQTGVGVVSWNWQAYQAGFSATSWPVSPAGTYTFYDGPTAADGSIDLATATLISNSQGGLDGDWLWNELYSPSLLGFNTHYDLNQPDHQSLTVDSEYRLATGGPLGSRQMNLWCISASATDADTGLPIPPEQISIGSFGNLDTNGNLWVMLPDNDPPVITPKAGKNNYTFTVGAQKYTLTLTANGLDLSTNTPEFCVGQQVNMQATWNPPLPGGIQTSYKWVLSDDYLNDFLTPATSDGSYYPYINSALLTNSLTPVWWYSGGYKYNWCHATNTFPNGQMLTLTGHGDVSIYQPSVRFQAGSPAYPMLYNGYLELGDEGLSQGNMTFACAITSKNDFPGVANWTQLNNCAVTGVSLAPTTSGQFWLDNAQFYNTVSNKLNGLPDNTPITPKGTILFADAPGVSDVGGWLSITDQFQTYLMFKPNPQESSIWVPLGLATWDWSATESSYTLSATNVIQASYINSNTFPQWLHTIHNTKPN